MKISNSDKKPEFSIIIPAYNAEKFIQRAIESVVQQKISDWELIIVENGSTDNTSNICLQYISDDRITVLHSGKGVSQARNVGMKAANGQWLIFLDADDELLEDTLEVYHNVIAEYAPDIVVGEYLFRNLKYNGKKQIYQGSQLKEYLKNSLQNPTQKCNTKAVAFNHELLKHYCIFFDESIDYAEDSVFFVKTFLNCSSLVSICYPVYKVTYHSQSAVRSGKKNLEREYISAINKIGKLLNLRDPHVKNWWYIFILNQLLIIFVNDIFQRDESIVEQKADAKKAIDIPEYKNAINKVDLKDISGPKKLVFKMMKIHFITGIYLAARVRQKQNKNKE